MTVDIASEDILQNREIMEIDTHSACICLTILMRLNHLASASFVSLLIISPICFCAKDGLKIHARNSLLSFDILSGY